MSIVEVHFLCVYKGSCFQIWSSQDLIYPPLPPPPPPPPHHFYCCCCCVCVWLQMFDTNTKQFFKTWYRWGCYFTLTVFLSHGTALTLSSMLGAGLGDGFGEMRVGCLLVSFPSWNWGSPSVGWEGRVYNCLPSPVHAVIQNAVLTCHSSSCTPSSGISMKEFVMSWRSLDLNAILTRK